MDLIKNLIELNNQIELKKLSKRIYTLESDEEEEEEICFVKELRRQFISEYLKINNRQFKMIKFR